MSTMNQLPYPATGVVDNASYTQTPEYFRPRFLEPAIMNKYLNRESLRNFLTANTITLTTSAYAYLEFDRIIGEVDWITEMDSFPTIDENYVPMVETVKSYGGKIRWSLREMETNQYNMINSKIDSAMNHMMLWENARTLVKMAAKLDHTHLANDETVSDWSDPSVGTPPQDIRKAMNRIGLNTWKTYWGDTLIMNTNTISYLYNYDFVQNQMYSNYMFNQFGIVPNIAGLPITAIEAVPDNTFYVFESGVVGEWVIMEPIRTLQWQPEARRFEQLIWTTAEPVINHPRVVYRGTIPAE